MSSNSEQLRCILQYYFEKGYKAAKAHKELCSLYGSGTLSKSTVERWFARFRMGNFYVKDAPRSGRPCTEKVDEILKKVEEDRHISSREIAKHLAIDHKTVLNHLEKAGYKKESGTWLFSSILTEKNRTNKTKSTDSETNPSRKRLHTSEEQLYQNPHSLLMSESEIIRDSGARSKRKCIQ